MNHVRTNYNRPTELFSLRLPWGGGGGGQGVGVQCFAASLILQATAVISAAPFPLPSSDCRKLTSQPGARSSTVSRRIPEKLEGERKRGREEERKRGRGGEGERERERGGDI